MNKTKRAWANSRSHSVQKEVSVWRDVSSIQPGQDFVLAIQAALSRCRVAVVWISPSFLDKSWGRQEARLLYELFQGEEGRLVPVWQDVTRDEIESVEPALSRITAIMSDDENLVTRVVERLAARREAEAAAASRSQGGVLRSRRRPEPEQ